MIAIGDKVIVIPNTCCHTGSYVGVSYKGLVIPKKAIVVPGTILVGEEVSVWNIGGQNVVVIDELIDRWLKLYGCSNYPIIGIDWDGYRAGCARDGFCENSGHSIATHIQTACGDPFKLYKGKISLSDGGSSVEIYPGGVIASSTLIGYGGLELSSYGSFVIPLGAPSYHNKTLTYHVEGAAIDYVFDTGITYDPGIYETYCASPVFTANHLWVGTSWSHREVGSPVRPRCSILATTEDTVTVNLYKPYTGVSYLITCPGMDYVLAKMWEYAGITWHIKTYLMKIHIDGSYSYVVGPDDYYVVDWCMGYDNSFIYQWRHDSVATWNFSIRRMAEDGSLMWSQSQSYNPHNESIGWPAIRKTGNTFISRVGDRLIERNINTGEFVREATSPVPLRGNVSIARFCGDYVYCPANDNKMVALRWFDFTFSHVFDLPFTVNEVIPVNIHPNEKWVEFVVIRTNNENWILRLHFVNAEIE